VALILVNFPENQLIKQQQLSNTQVQTNCLDITMARKTSCKNVATRVGRFAQHIIFLLGAIAPCPPPANDALASASGVLDVRPII